MDLRTLEFLVLAYRQRSAEVAETSIIFSLENTSKSSQFTSNKKEYERKATNHISIKLINGDLILA